MSALELAKSKWELMKEVEEENKLLTLSEPIFSLFSTCLHPTEEMTLLANDICSQAIDSQILQNQTRRQIILRLFSIFNQCNILTLPYIWEKMKEMWKGALTRDSSPLSFHYYHFLTHFYRDFFDLDDGNCFFVDLRGDDECWESIQSGLESKESFSRKQSNFLLKSVISSSKAFPNTRPKKWTKYAMRGNLRSVSHILFLDTFSGMSKFYRHLQGCLLFLIHWKMVGILYLLLFALL